jgi:D-psicose/D-tagatose/L-ribulose 3-epimerase
MRVSLCNEVIAGLDFARQCEFARAVGYDGIEIAPFTLDEEPQRLSSARRAEVGRIARDAGVAITGLHYLMVAPKGLSITAADADVRRATLGAIGGPCQLAADLGAPLLVHGSPAQRQLEPGRETEGHKHGIECMAAAAAAAEAAGVLYLLEPLACEDTGFINTVEEAVAVVRAIGSPSLPTMLDCSAAGRAEADPIPDVLHRWLPTGLIAHIHLNDPNRRGPGEGALAFGPILAALKGLWRYGRDRALNLRAGRAELCRARHRLCGSRCAMAPHPATPTRIRLDRGGSASLCAERDSS